MTSRTFKATYDLAIIGGGIVGLATARQVLLKNPKLLVCVIEKENELATHQSNRNSGVVHAGLYYKKGTLKSKFCVRGSKLIKDYCHSKNLPFKECGKLIIATEKDELDTLHRLYDNAIGAGIQNLQLVSKDRVAKIQPGCNNALEAIWSPNTAIVDWRKVALSFANDFERSGGDLITNFLVTSMEPVESDTVQIMENGAKEGEKVRAKSVVNCAGLFSDYIARQTLNNEHPKVVPFKGNYFLLSDRIASRIKTNIYPVPNPDLPFLGVHITPRVDGSALVGPTSILTLGYEHYDRNSPVDLVHMYHIFFRSGLRKLILKEDNIKAGLMELYRYFSKSRVTRDVSRFLPEIKYVDLIQTNFCGIRAQVVSKDGELVDDFLFETGRGVQFNKVLHVRNCPSPAATSSLAIADRVLSILEERFI